MHGDTISDYKKFTGDVKQYDLDAEFKLIAGMLGPHPEIVSDISARMDPEDFYDLAFRGAFEIIKGEVEKNGLGEDPVAWGIVLSVKHREALSKLPWNTEIVASHRNLLGYTIGKTEIEACMKKVKQKRELRDLLAGLFECVDACRHNQDNNETAYAILQELLFNRKTDAQEETISAFDFASGMLDVFYDGIDETKRKERTVNLRWKKFQRNCGGLGAENLVIVSAPSGKGKSAFALNIAENVGVTQDIPTLYINSELSNEQMQMRMDSLMAYVDSRKIAEGEYSEDGHAYEPVEKAIRDAAGTFRKKSLLFKKIPDLQLSNIESALRKDANERKTRLVIVDYLGRMDVMKTAGKRDLQEWQILKMAAMRLKTLAIKYKLCIVMVAQLTDDGHLQGSRGMKNECDLWINIERLKSDDFDSFPYNTLVQVMKTRNSEDEISMKFRYDGCMMRFSDSAEGIKEMIENNRRYGIHANEIMTESEYKRLCDIETHEKRGQRNG